MYKCKGSFSISQGKIYSINQQISESEYRSLTSLQQQNFQLDTSSSNYNTESPIVIMSDGDLGLNLGGGLSFDLSDGNLGINTGGGFSIDI